MNTDLNSTFAPAFVDCAVVDRARTQASMWAVPLHGIRMPLPIRNLASVAVTYTATATAAQGATKDATGDEAFEDPV